MRRVAISTLGVLAILSLGAKPKVVHEQMPDRPPSGGRFRIQTGAWGSSWDWNQDTGQIPGAVIRAVHRGLYRLDANGGLEKDLADSETASADARVWTFRIQSGIQWSDGTPLVAQHFVDGILRASAPEAPSLPEVLRNLEGAEAFHSRQSNQTPSIQALSARAFEVRLVRPDPLFPLKWLDTRLMPARGDLAQVHQKSYGFEPEKMAFLGSMLLRDSRPGLRTLMVPNPRHPEPSSVTRIELWHTPTAAQSRSLFDRGHLDLTLDPIPGAKPGNTLAVTSENLVALVPQTARAKNRWASLALSAALARRDLPRLSPSLDWISERLWRLQGQGEYPTEARLDTLSLEARPTLAKALLKQSGLARSKSPLRIFAEKQDTTLLKSILKQANNSLQVKIITGSRREADWILTSFKNLSWSADQYLERITGDSNWRKWGELPVNDPKRAEIFLKGTKSALFENPALIPLGFERVELNKKPYLNSPKLLGTGDLDLAHLSYDPQALARPRRKP